MRVSVLSYSFHGMLERGTIDIFGFLETCKYRYQLAAADLWNAFLKSTEEGYLRQVKEGLDERELVVPNLACDECVVWVDDPTERARYHQNALAHLNAAKILGARFARFDAGGNPEGIEWTNEEFDHIVKRYREYAQYAYDNGFKAGAESHWGPEASWPSLEKLCKAVDHPGFAICCHIGGWKGTQAEKDLADRECVPWVAHTHIPWNITEGPLVEKMTNLRDGGYQGYYSVEHHSGKDEYAEVAIQLAKVRAVLQTWRAG
ncbi:MAG TPA: TIM barrel protein [Candidatus Bathyarchaeia archaeon]|nr:TIM barrel protein [Candidatus Bathyarchaeia archaeon]